MNSKERRHQSLRVPIILGSITLLCGIIGFAIEVTGGPKFFAGIAGATLVQQFLQPLARLEMHLYQTIQMLQFEYAPEAHGNVIQNPFLFVARWLGPLALIWTAVIAYFQLRREETIIKKIKHWNHHTIVCGYGEIGRRIVESLLEKKERVVVIDPDIEKDHFDGEAKSNCLLIRQDANISSTLDRARVSQAKYLIGVTGQDLMNFSILANAKTLLDMENPDHRLVAFAHVHHNEIVAQVQDYPLFQLAEEQFDGRIFNANNLAARLVFKKHPPDKYHLIRKADAPPVHVIIFGFNAFVQSLVTHLARTAHFLNDTKTQITVVADDTQNAWDRYLGRYPMIKAVVDLDFVNCHPDCLQQSHIETFKNKEPISMIYLCHENEIVQTLTLNRIRDIWQHQIDTVVCQSGKIHMPNWVNEKNKVHLYDPFTKACTHEMIIQDQLEKMAEKFHSYYLQEERERFAAKVTEYEVQKAEGEIVNEPQPKASMVEWAELSEEFKQSNRSLADHLEVKLRAIGCEACSKNDSRPAEEFTRDPELINQLANMEHRRWNADKYLSGWKYGEKRIDTLKIHDNLVPWSELPDKIKQYDINTMKNIAEILGSEEFQLKICQLKKQE